ncbi:MAG TPA: hypothetical protein VHO70_06740 [Chitinispirillaceae bacterium]|nr:hypothetical protein [Chitinispirillaceae bacterium]
MLKIIMLLTCSGLCAQLLFADSDTTYGRIRIKQKTTSSGGSESEGSSDESFFASCMKSCVSATFDGCIDLIFNNKGETTITYDNDQTEYRQPRNKKITKAQAIIPCGYSSSPFHFSGGAALGGLIYSKGIAAGLTVGGTTGISWFPEDFIGLRLAIEPTVAFDNLYVEMEKDVYVDGLMVGITTFSSDRAQEFILPLSAQLLIVPTIPSRAMFVSFGGGGCYKKENVWGKRSFNGNVSDSKITFNQWCPAFRIGMGFFLPLEKIFGIFELSYSIIANKNSNIFETPGDNSRCGHIPAISFSISTP